MAKIYNSMMQNVERGMRGLNKGLPMGLPKTSKIIFDVQRGRYDLIAGKTSAGKTALVDQCYVIEPFYFWLNNPQIKLDILYFSLEISPEEKFAKFASRFLLDRYGRNLNPNEILSRGDHKLTEEWKKELDKVEDIFEQLEEVLHIYDAYTTRKSIMSKVKDFLDNHGTYAEVDGRIVYTSHDPTHYVIVIVDNYNNLDSERGETKKEAIDGLSKDLVRCKKVTGITAVPLQQFNADISDPRRIQQKRYEPIADDLEDTKMPSKDADVFLAVYDPIEYNVKVHRGYDVAMFNGMFRQLQVIKNRNGIRGSRVGLHLTGGQGIFNELPSADLITLEDYRKFQS
jgi:replicative DNA helicase